MRRDLGVATPKLVCLTVARRGAQGMVVDLFDRHRALRVMRDLLRDPEVRLVAHNMAFDARVLAAADTSGELVRLWFDAYADGRVYCTMIRERLIDLSKGLLGYQPKNHYRLDETFRRYTQRELPKEDTWRLRYGELYDTPVEQWPFEAVKYAKDDAVAHLEVFEAQGGVGAVVDDVVQAREDFALQLSATWGVRTDPYAVAALERTLNEKMSTLAAYLTSTRILKPDGVKDTGYIRALVEDEMLARTGKVNRTATGMTSISGDVLLACETSELRALAEFVDLQKVVGTFMPTLRRGVTHPVCPEISVLQNNGRTSYSSPNLQQLPRDGGVRECIVPRPGNVFIDGDYSTLEVRTFAQVLWWLVKGRTLLDLFNKDPNFDPHARLAAQILGVSYDAVKAKLKAKDAEAKKYRQMSKPANFGFQGGMGADTFVGYAASGYGVTVTLDESKHLREQWRKSVPEARHYFGHVSNLTRNDRATIAQFVSGRVRGGMGFTDLANGYWSALANDGAKHAFFLIARECYSVPNSPLYGCRPVVFNHDQFVVEAPEAIAPDAAARLRVLAEGGMRAFVPDVPIVNDPALMRRWSKDGGDPVYDRNGRLIPYEDREKK